MSEDVKVADTTPPAPVAATDDTLDSFMIEFNLNPKMVKFLAKVGLEVILKQRLNDIAENIKE